MKQYIKLIVFVGILGFITSLAFVGMDLLFSAKIEANANEALYKAILIHNDIDFNDDNLFDVFESSIQVEIYDINGQEVKLFIDNQNDNISFVFGVFAESGYINDIIGVLTIEDDFITIVNITILEQGETPGLGGKVVLREFLDQFMGLQFDENSETPIIIGTLGPTGDLPNEVDQIAGATNTSNAFMRLLNESYAIYKNLWESRG